MLGGSGVLGRWGLLDDVLPDDVRLDDARLDDAASYLAWWCAQKYLASMSLCITFAFSPSSQKETRREKSACSGSSRNDVSDDGGDGDDSSTRKCATHGAGGTRAHSLLLRAPMPYPLGNDASCAARGRGILRPRSRSGVARRPFPPRGS